MTTKAAQLETQKIPKLRFSGFLNGWEEKKLWEVAEIIMGQSPDSSFYNTDGIGKYLVQGKADISDRKTSPRNWTTQITRECRVGDVIMTVRAPVGYIAKSLSDSCIGRGVCAIRNKKMSNIEFLYQFLLSYEEKWTKYSQGSTFTAVNSKDIKALKITTPLLLEQQKIASFLSSTDEWIENLKTQKESFESYKKGMMQKIFSQEIRFKDDKGNEFPKWEEKKLGDICEYKNGGSFESKVVENGKYKLITLNSIDINGKLKNNHKTVSETDWFLKKDDLIMVLSDVAHGNFLGLVDIIPNNNEYVLNQRMGLLRKKDNEVDLNFLRTYINKKQSYFKLHGQGSSQQNLSKGDILKFKIPIPLLQEQHKIAEFLTSIDKITESKQQQIIQAEQWKKGLIQKLFV